MTKPDKETIASVLRSLREPSGNVTDAMAAARREAESHNGHGHHAYLDMWIAGIEQALREVA